MKSSSSTPIAALLCHWDAFGSRYRQRALRDTARHLLDRGWPVFVVEGRYPLQTPVKPIDGATLWTFPLDPEAIFFHKESLFNAGIARVLDLGYRFVALLDADLRFLEADARDVIINCLEAHRACQIGSFMRYLTADGRPEVYTWQRMLALWQWATEPSSPRPDKAKPGFGWAIRSDVLERLGSIADRVVFGGGDTLLASCLYGRLSERVLNVWSPRMIDYGRTEIDRIHPLVRGDVVAAPLHIEHRWHGDIQYRRYVSRYQIARQYDFDPEQHLEQNADGMLRWSDAAPLGLRDRLCGYMYDRREL